MQFIHSIDGDVGSFIDISLYYGKQLTEYTKLISYRVYAQEESVPHFVPLSDLISECQNKVHLLSVFSDSSSSRWV